MARLGGITAILHLMHVGSPRCRANACAALVNLATHNENNCRALLVDAALFSTLRGVCARFAGMGVSTHTLRCPAMVVRGDLEPFGREMATGVCSCACACAETTRDGEVCAPAGLLWALTKSFAPSRQPVINVGLLNSLPNLLLEGACNANTRRNVVGVLTELGHATETLPVGSYAPEPTTTKHVDITEEARALCVMCDVAETGGACLQAYNRLFGKADVCPVLGVPRRVLRSPGDSAIRELTAVFVCACTWQVFLELLS